MCFRVGYLPEEVGTLRVWYSLNVSSSSRASWAARDLERASCKKGQVASNVKIFQYAFTVNLA